MGKLCQEKNFAAGSNARGEKGGWRGEERSRLEAERKVQAEGTGDWKFPA
jgi:hypothetical protein